LAAFEVHIASLDASYDVTENWTLGGKYAYRRGEVSLDRENPEFFDNDAHLFILRAGVGYNFTDYSDDLTDLSFDWHGLFFNLIGTL
jgi:long-subunit fatty acid transport protein